MVGGRRQEEVEQEERNAWIARAGAGAGAALLLSLWLWPAPTCVASTSYLPLAALLEVITGMRSSRKATAHSRCMAVSCGGAAGQAGQAQGREQAAGAADSTREQPGQHADVQTVIPPTQVAKSCAPASPHLTHVTCTRAGGRMRVGGAGGGGTRCIDAPSARWGVH